MSVYFSSILLSSLFCVFEYFSKYKINFFNLFILKNSMFIFKLWSNCSSRIFNLVILLILCPLLNPVSWQRKNSTPSHKWSEGSPSACSDRPAAKDGRPGSQLFKSTYVSSIAITQALLIKWIIHWEPLHRTTFIRKQLIHKGLLSTLALSLKSNSLIEVTLS